MVVDWVEKRFDREKFFFNLMGKDFQKGLNKMKLSRREYNNKSKENCKEMDLSKSENLISGGGSSHYSMK